MFKMAFITIFTSLMALSSSQRCDSKVVEWFPHQYSCSKFILCFHGNEIEKSCAPNLHFNAETLQCDFPERARCSENFLCPLEDDVNNPVFYPDRNDCQRYFICFKGSPIHRSCADGLWWDVNDEWCTVEDKVTCDEQTTNNPQSTTSTILPTSTTTESLPTAPTQPPSLSTCYAIRHLFNLENGKYLKSFCTFSTSSTHEQSQNFCRNNNMESFVIDNSAVQAAFFEATTESLAAYPQGFVWINGRRESTGEWFTFSPNRQPLYSGIDWVQTETVIGQDNGDCLGYTMIHGHYQAMGQECSRVHWFTCQFFDEPPRVNTEICTHEIPLIDDDGNYLKTSCIVNTLETYESGEQMCHENGMKLFVINNSTVQSALFTTTTERLSVTEPNGFLWINGRRDARSGEWFTFSPQRAALYDGIDWVQTNEVHGPTNGDCLRFSSQHGPYQAKGDDCTSVLSWIICEY